MEALTTESQAAPQTGKSSILPPLTRRYAVERNLKRLDRGLYRAYKLRKRAMPYDDTTATFFGGDLEELTHRNYEKALANLWKAEVVAPSLGFRDASREERRPTDGNAAPQSQETRDLVEKARSDGFRDAIRSALDPDQRRALARILSIILHGEAHALFVSASLVPHVRGTGAKLGMAMQVMEEAKHFVVMREVVKRIDRVYPQNFSDFFALDMILRARPMDRLFGMNLVVESVAMTFFSTFTNYPGLSQILPFFHKDESRHSAYPKSYTAFAPLSFWTKHSPLARQRRMNLVFPLLLLLVTLKEDFDKVGLDIFEFGGKLLDKVSRLAEQTGFYLPLPRADMMRMYNLVFNLHLRMTDRAHFEGFRDYTQHHSYRIREDLQEVEDQIYGTGSSGASGWYHRLMEGVYGRLARAIDPSHPRAATA
ncbi:MAG: hypothetical protein HYT87_20090 [Nitrospirae bacterium]|nr:hypothetical protein [Nitrospirota bacterium]